jgi:hypothetical protein
VAGLELATELAVDVAADEVAVVAADEVLLVVLGVCPRMQELNAGTNLPRADRKLEVAAADVPVRLMTGPP